MRPVASPASRWGARIALRARAGDTLDPRPRGSCGPRTCRQQPRATVPPARAIVQPTCQPTCRGELICSDDCETPAPPRTQKRCSGSRRPCSPCSPQPAGRPRPIAPRRTGTAAVRTRAIVIGEGTCGPGSAGRSSTAAALTRAGGERRPTGVGGASSPATPSRRHPRRPYRRPPSASRCQPATEDRSAARPFRPPTP